MTDNAGQELPELLLRKIDERISRVLAEMRVLRADLAALRADRKLVVDAMGAGVLEPAPTARS